MQKKAKRAGKLSGARAVNGNTGSINVIICGEPVTHQPIAEVELSPREDLGSRFFIFFICGLSKYMDFYLVDKVRDKRRARITKVFPLKDKICQDKTR